ncbi:MAG: FAD-dependent oxidoreductase [Gammaproteobacteria bacterium]|nr:MAG: FAD-dependent oxidoreductase [Gammaproteobacteria bacterium]
MSDKGPWLPWATLDWSDEGMPASPDFGDVYFSRADGLAESRYVFVEGNLLPERFAGWKLRRPFVIGETGFGTGLNFLAALEAFKRHAPPQARLHFFSIEKFPVRPEDIRRTARSRGVSENDITTLLGLYPEPVSGLQRRTSADGRITLSIWFGDVREALDRVSFQADAWFLDGFSPACNPDMWADDVLARLREHSAPGSTLATFTAVGRIRRTLTALGYQVSKVPGFGHKRDMTRARLDGSVPDTRSGHVLVVGAGIAGATLANHLAANGCRVSVFEAGTQPASGASGNPQGALYFKPGVEYSPHTRLHAAAYGYAMHFYLHRAPEHLYPCGLAALAHSERERQRQQRFLSRNDYGDWVREISADRLTRQAGTRVATGGLFFPQGGWLRPAEMVRQLLNHPLIEVRTGVCIHQLDAKGLEGEDARGKRVRCEGDAVVVAAGHASAQWLPSGRRQALKPIRGQIIHGHVTDWPLRQVLCGEGYAMPADHGRVTLGATFSPNDADTEPRHADSAQILEQARALIPDGIPSDVQWTPRASIRAAAPDYMPVAGQSQSGLFFLSGLGSKGFMLAPLLSAHLADTLMKGLPALDNDLADRVRPDRFVEQEAANERVFRTTQSANPDATEGAAGITHRRTRQ